MTVINPKRVIAAGCVVVRGQGRQLQVLVVHRRRRMDWSLPKGKQEPGEPLPVTAVRETLEEAAVEVALRQSVVAIDYISIGRPKHVKYWLAVPINEEIASGRQDKNPDWQANDEVDEVRWVSPRKAMKLLTYQLDQDVLRKALEVWRPTMPFILLRHAEAEKRAAFAARHKGKPPHDHERPLTEAGEVRARELAGVLNAFGIQTATSSPAKRCFDTVAISFRKSSEIEVVGAISEFSFRFDPEGAASAALKLSRINQPLVVVCHRPVLPTMVEAIAIAAESEVPSARLRPGEYLVCHRPLDRKGRLSGTDFIWEYSADDLA